MQDEYFMKIALKEAEKAMITGDVPIGAVIVKDGKVISKGRNTKEKTNVATRHAEMNAIEKAEKKIGVWRLSECTLYTTLEPCPMCAGAIQQARIDRVVFGAKDKKHGAYGSCFDFCDIEGLNHYPLVESSVLEEDCSKILSDFFADMRKKKKLKNKQADI